MSYKTEAGKICVICGGHYPFASKDAYGVCPNRHKKWLPAEVQEILICWECVHSLHQDLGEHIRNFSYSLLFVDHSSTNHKEPLEEKK